MGDRKVEGEGGKLRGRAPEEPFPNAHPLQAGLLRLMPLHAFLSRPCEPPFLPVSGSSYSPLVKNWSSASQAAWIASGRAA